VTLDRRNSQALKRRVGTGAGGTFYDSPGNYILVNKSRYTHGRQVTGVQSGIPVTDTEMVSSLTRIPIEGRRDIVLWLTPMAALLLICGILPTVAGAPLQWQLAGAGVALIAGVLLGIVYGLYRSVSAERVLLAESLLDDALIAATASAGSGCGDAICGVAGGCASPGASGLTDRECAAETIPRN
jgi:hypothetical protein